MAYIHLTFALKIQNCGIILKQHIYLLLFFQISLLVILYILGFFVNLNSIIGAVTPFGVFKPKEKKIPQKNNKQKKDKTKLQLLIGYDKNKKCDTYIPESGLYQNFLITGTIGSGKTSSAMYPFTKQLIRYQCQTSDLKLGMLILDVKGNYYEKVLEFAKKYGRLDDIIVIELKRESEI